MKKTLLLALFVASTLTLQSCGSNEKKDSAETAEQLNDDKKSVDSDDAEFAVKAASGGLLEVALGKMAQKKGISPAVKEFGAMMVQDHSKANDELKAIAVSKNIALPSTPGEDQQKHIDDLAKLSGKDFDKKYASLVVDDHKEDVDEFDKGARECKDPELKAYAAKTATVVKGHLEKIKAINDAL